MARVSVRFPRSSPKLISTRATHPSRAYGSARPVYTCELDEEPVSNYKPGGYHPLHIGDQLDNGRFKVLQKVGWGGFSTVWAARDQSTDCNVALKVLQAAASGNNREIQILRALREKQSNDRGSEHRVSLHHDFEINGPNGVHDCLVLDLTGPSIQTYINRHVEDGRLSGKLAKSFARQALKSISGLHAHDVGHGDVHLRNLVLSIPDVARMGEDDFYKALGKPIIEPVKRIDGGNLDSNVPHSIVKPAAWAADDHLDFDDVKLVDFGAAFEGTLGAESLLNPPVIRPPEAMFDDTLDKRIDLWSVGCTIFELVTGQTPFESGNSTPESIARQMVYTIDDEVPERWQAQRKALEKEPPSSRAPNLQQWLEVVYFEREGDVHLSRDEVKQAGEVISRLLRFEPSKRSSAEEILNDSWLAEG